MVTWCVLALSADTQVDVQLVARPVLLSTYIYLEKAAKLAAIYSHL